MAAFRKLSAVLPHQQTELVAMLRLRADLGLELALAVPLWSLVAQVVRLVSAVRLTSLAARRLMRLAVLS